MAKLVETGSPWQGRNVESLVEEWLETGDDAILDVLEAGDEDFINGTVLPRPFFKDSYDAGTQCCHVHFVWKGFK